MKVTWNEGQRVLQLVAESADELRLIAELSIQQALPGAQWLKVPVAEVPFQCADEDGITTLMGSPCKVLGLAWPQRRAVPLQASVPLGEAVDEVLRLVGQQLKVHLGGAAAGVAPVQGDLEEQTRV